MSDREFEKKIKDSFEKITPDVLASVLADCEEKEAKAENAYVTREVITARNPVKLRRFASLAAVFVILLGSVIGVNAYQMNKAINARVSLDVNPSVEIQVNKKERVLNVVPLNEDGKVIIGDMDFSGSDIDVAVNALVGSMMRNGYLSEISNSILVTVSGKDAEKDAALQARVADEIDKILAGNKVSGAILSQVLVEDRALDDLAKEYGITAGKAKLIKEIIEKNNLYTIEELVPLTINELNLLTLSHEIEFVDIKAQGKASDTAYIGNDAAETKALEHAGIAVDDAVKLRSKMEVEDGRMVYEVEFDAAGYEYEYEIDAKTGEVIKVEKDVDDDYRPTTASNSGTNSTGTNNSGTSSDSGSNGGTSNAGANNAGTSSNSGSNGGTSNSGTNNTGTTSGNSVTTQKVIGNDAAQSKALSHAGLSAGQVTELEVEYDADDAEYDVSFKAGGYEYDYEVDAYTGAIIKVEKEEDDDYMSSGNSGSTTTASAPAQQTPTQSSTPAQQTPTQSSTPTQSAPTQAIGDAAAQSKALSHAGLSAGQVTEMEVEYDADEAKYDVSFKTGCYEYDYEVDAYTGAIIKVEKEEDDDYMLSGNSGSTTTASAPAQQTPTQSSVPAQQTPTQSSTPTQSAPTKQAIGDAAAQSKALSHAGLSAGQVTEMEVEYDADEAKYDVSFKAGGYEYDYEVDAYTGAIIKAEKESDD